MTDTQQMQLKPEQIDLGDNIRFAIDPAKVRALADSIVEMGGVQEPITVFAKPGNRYGLLKGFYRYSAVELINKETSAGLTLPAQLKDAPDTVTRLKLQVTENVARAAMSPMDTANSIKQLLDAGVSKLEVRRLFPRVGGRKGALAQPASNSSINQSLSLLSLPKAVQTKIHQGLISASAGYKLAAIESAEERAEVLAAAEAAVQRELDREDAEEQKLLKVEEKETAKANEKATKEKDIADLEAKVVECRNNDKVFREMVKAKLKALTDAKKADYDSEDKKAVSAWHEAVKAADTDHKAAKKALMDNSKDLERAITKRDKLKESLTVKAEEKAPAKLTKPAKKAAVGPKDIDKAQKAKGESTSTPLKATEMRQALKDIAGDKDKTVAAIGALFLDLLDGKTTPKLLVGDLKKALK